MSDAIDAPVENNPVRLRADYFKKLQGISNKSVNAYITNRNVCESKIRSWYK